MPPTQTDDLLPGGPLGLLAAAASGLPALLALRSLGLFGSGGRPALPPPPLASPHPGPHGEGPAQEAMEQLSARLAEMQKQIAGLHKAAGNAAEAAAANSDDGRLAVIVNRGVI